MASPSIQRFARLTERHRANIVAFGWGLAEATIFFIVPDVWLTRLSLGSFRRAFVASLWAVAGALLGGVVLWSLARHGAAPGLYAVFDKLPGISPSLIEATGHALDQRGLFALATGALSGKPYKLYAVHAGEMGIGLTSFIAASLIARLARFLLTSAAARVIGKAFESRGESFRLRLHLVVWLGFYLCYFVIMRG